MSKSDARGFTILIAVLTVVAMGSYLFFQHAEKTDEKTQTSSQEDKELAAFQQLVKQDSIAREENYAEYTTTFYQQNARRAPKKHYDARKRRVVETFPFNPNTCDSATFVRLGLPTWMASNAMKYRRKGGIWHSPDDFQRLYGLTESDFNRLKPYIVIDEKHRKKNTTYSTAENHNDKQIALSSATPTPATQEEQNQRTVYPKKYKEGETILDLNMCDTAELKRIPGIGSYYAKRICKYRNELGGFVSTQQLAEIPDLPEELEKWFSTTPQPNIRTINVNKATFKELVHHPYLNYEQVKEITNYIRKYGPLHSWNDLRISPYFTPNDFQRLQPYFTF